MPIGVRRQLFAAWTDTLPVMISSNSWNGSQSAHTVEVDDLRVSSSSTFALLRAVSVSLPADTKAFVLVRVRDIKSV